MGEVSTGNRALEVMSAMMAARLLERVFNFDTPGIVDITGQQCHVTRNYRLLELCQEDLGLKIKRPSSFN